MKQTEMSYLEITEEILRHFPHISKDHEGVISKLIEANQNGDLYLSSLDSPSINNFQNQFPFHIETIENEKRLFFQKTYTQKLHFESRIKELIRNRENKSKEFNETKIETMISRLETFFKQTLAKEQKQAVMESVTSSFRIIAGGPGTGKTTVVSFILKLLDELEILPNVNQIALVAPTGRAAQRLTESVQKNLSFFPDVSDLVSSLRGQTIHSLLKIFPDEPKPYYGSNRYLPYDLIIMDETSMVDLTLMNLFLDSISDRTQLILLGDPNQLPSVGQGEVLADLINEFRKKNQLISELKTNHRSSASSKFSKFAELVKNSFEDTSMNLHFPTPDIREPSQDQPEDDFIWLQKDTPKQNDKTPFKDWKADDLIYFLWKDFFLPTAKKTVEFLWNQEDLTNPQNKKSLEELISEYRCLTILRKGYYGIESLQIRILNLAKKQLTSQVTDQHNIGYRHLAKSFYFQGMPIIIKRNDQIRKLFNGDIGLVLKINSELRAVFPIENRLYSFALDTLPEHEPAFFLTIHKSQGSEYNTILLYLPPIFSLDSDSKEIPLLNRRILYTAVTRAKKKVILMGDYQTWNLGLETFRKRNTGVQL
ncbi:exodeoxyribonuclease V subunit alpha [Leptospira congkakensis]|uniref:RecBCD enzyme subunit RecD n=1 Tax=Leptospira congkakensis TaxID=2484932 RepID=A0A4Z1A8P4_9LEPT|nr:exodeoxyribonuclease V subunit alpha [Leptospira congkakensis]TGL85247.1 exodeoxyribonuclease V subunit alpha [Leptospira congkakensis]TGL85362.1 exodeoxyribonuclease V subunit alpha [Leptospira congkakensis]TGL99894.1 exodeoxyribonuclease V subunit alpha [Leptospira congkakensis]